MMNTFIRNNRDKVFWSFLILWIIASIIFIGILNVESIIIHGIAILIFSILTLLQNINAKFCAWLDRTSKYKLSKDETRIWNSIQIKAAKGYDEFCEECIKDKNYWGWPWVSPGLIKEEQELIRKIHEYFYPGDYIVDPIGCAQADYAWYSDIKNKIIY